MARSTKRRVAGYGIYGRVLHSELPLPELSPLGAAGARFAPMCFDHRLPIPPDAGWFTIWHRPDGLPWVRAARTASGYHVQYCRCAEFALDLQRRTIRGAAIDCSPDMFRHFLVDQVVPMMLSVDAVVLHASAVEVDGALVAFAGPGGSGKSTLALALARRGHEVASDDGLLLVTGRNGTTAVPAYAGIRLWPDTEAALADGLRGSGRPHSRAKRRFREGLSFAAAGAMTQLFVIDPAPSAAVTFTRLSPRDAAVELIKQAFRLALDDSRSLARQLDAIVGAAADIAAWRLSFPRAFAAAPSVAAAVESHVRAHLAAT